MAWNSKGIALDKLGRHEEALACFDKALALNPQYAKAWNSKGVVLSKLGRAKEAEECFQKARALGP